MWKGGNRGVWEASNKEYKRGESEGGFYLEVAPRKLSASHQEERDRAAGEKRKEEEMIEIEGSFGRIEALNSELASLEKELSALRKSGAIDSFGLYLYGIILRDRGRENLAITVLVESVNSFPWNWNAWLELQSLCTTTETLNKLNLKHHWMKDFFLASAYQELKAHDEALKRYESLQAVFRRSNNIQAQIATALYGLRELDEAEVVFEEILRNDPLKGQHEKAVLYFRRALKLNRKYLSAWTLMGHEYVEMKNTPAAIDAYRRAVDINPRDYRAWYGLGQTYEMMSMPFYALYYFKKASFLQPNDARLWVAMAQCYQSAPLQMLEDAIKCYMKAVNCNEREGIALHELAKLHCNLGHSEKAAYFYKKDLEMMDAEERQGPNMIEALLFLTKYLKAEKRFEEAEVYCTRLLDYSGPEKETAMSLLRGLRIAQSGPPSSSGLEQFITP
ncbi:Anaphase-promoting complex subunit 8 [Platanthera zijinensis]|uniref:Anaphase-promoting complex subunit 8 n=1 Tax=Platanthera zijinensis TaxID=2320716 RepID=A0AAP0G813_9ASPA